MSPRFKVDLATKLGPLELKNPVLVSSGTFGYGGEYAEFYDPSSLGGIVTKSITLDERPGNPPPRLVETPSGLINSIGLQNVGVDRFISEKLPVLREIGTVRIVNIAGSTIREYVAVAKKLEGLDGFDAFELNISCPNVKAGGIAFGTSPSSAGRLTAAVRKATVRPLIVKLSPNVADILPVARAAVDAGADVLSLVNTYRAMAIDVESRRPALGAVTGGLSGPAIRPLAIYHVFRLSLNLGAPLIGMGGIQCGRDALEFILAGAHAVSIGTASFIDPTAPMRALGEIRDYCVRRRVRSVSGLIGAAHRGRPQGKRLNSPSLLNHEP
ncbi:MAG: dihydroorotate dehydrogenase [bacterium]